MYLRNLFRLPTKNKNYFSFNNNINNRLKNIIIVNIPNTKKCLLCLTNGRCAFNQNQICFPD